ncbi:MAG: outer membrane protein assembly factor BamC [Oleiphilaceae bacterium]|jgi:outer membrane protein assembly factor BamC
MQSIIRCMLAFSFLSVASCGFIQDRSTEYAQAEKGQALVVPEGYSAIKLKPRYPIPEIENERSIPETYELPEPPNATAAINNDPFTIETVNKQTWLRLYTAPGKVWPLLDYFWAKHGIKVAYEEISKGFLVTEPFISSASSSLKSELTMSIQPVELTEDVIFQAKLKQGIRRNTAELQIRALKADASLNKWQKISVNAQLEQAMLSLIGEYIVSDSLDNRHSLLANDIGGESRVRLLKDDSGEGYLELLLSFDRAWSEINKALSSAEVLVSDFDRSIGKYFISYIQEEDMTAWYDISGSEVEKRAEKNISLQLEETEEGKTIVRVKILNPQFEVEKEEELINLIFEHIS